MADKHPNLARSTVLAGPTPATSGTTIVVATGDGEAFTPPCRVTAWPQGASPTRANAEILRVTAQSGDTLTVTRHAETWPGSGARAISGGWNLSATITAGSLGGYLSLGQTQVDCGSYATLGDAIAANGAGKVYNLTGQSYTSSTDVPIQNKNIYRGGGMGNTTLTLTGTARFVTDNYDTLTGTNPNAPACPEQWGIEDMAIEGGGGVRAYGHAWWMRNVVVRGTSGTPVKTEWTNNDNPIPPGASMEACMFNVHIHHGGVGGLYFDGPHDSWLEGVFSYFNTSGVGIVLGPKAPGTHLHTGHIYGVDHSIALQMLGAGQQVTSTQAEGANGPQVEIRKAGSKFHGRVFSAQGNENVKGVVIGASGDLAAGVTVDAVIENCRSGALDVTYDGGGSRYDITVNSTTGTPLVGNMPINSLARINLLGGIELNGWGEPWVVGNVHHTGTIDTLGGLVAAYGSFRIENHGTGSTMGLTNVGATAPGNPNSGSWKLYLMPGTTGGTVKLVARGASGTVTTILDNIPD